MVFYDIIHWIASPQYFVMHCITGACACTVSDDNRLYSRLLFYLSKWGQNNMSIFQLLVSVVGIRQREREYKGN